MFTALLYAPFMNQVRPAVAEIFKTSVPFLDNLRSAQPIDPAKGLQDFSLRLEGFDWLVGLMTVGREAFPPWISLRGEMVVLLNSLVPGDIIDASEWVPLGALMPVLLKGYALKSLEAHRVVAGIAGIAYLYSGYILGPLFFFVWSFLSVRVLASRLTVFVKMLYFRLFVVDMVTGGHLSNTVMRFYEGMLCLVAAYFVHRWLHRVSPRCRIAAPQWPPGRREGREPGLGMT
ncbi:MAG: hypothetical protein HY238_19525 [Acidobacteria bacterium]|nr:hypothetical protein [Acidobacteriota bacterium]